MFDAFDGPGYVPLRVIHGVYIVPLMMMWFPDVIADYAGMGNEKT